MSLDAQTSKLKSEQQTQGHQAILNNIYSQAKHIQKPIEIRTRPLPWSVPSFLEAASEHNCTVNYSHNRHLLSAAPLFEIESRDDIPTEGFAAKLAILCG
jgi:hypothetical protein